MPAAPKGTGGTITASVMTVGAPVTLTFKFDIGADYTQGNLVLVELDPLYTGLPVCEF